jgi:F-type H+-transporting ATPase subunit b
MKKCYFVLCFLFSLSTNSAWGSEKGMPQLDTEFWLAQIFWLLLIFSSLYIVIWKIFLPKITDSIENRKSRVMNDLNEAQKLKEEADKKLIEYNKIIEDIKKEARKIIDDSKKRIEIDIKNKKQKFDKEIEKELIDIEIEIKNLKKNSIDNINKIATEISSAVIKQLIETEANMSNVLAVVEDISKRELAKNL